jgi:hydrogenase nickel incorporation protein HypA/HybF
MHELSIALSLLETLEIEAIRRAPARITAIYLKIGPLSGVIPSALLSAFELIIEGTELQQCKIHIEETRVIIHCPTCLADRSVESVQLMSCTVCGTASADIAAGRELDFCSMEITE